MGARNDITGQVFGELTVIGFVGKDKHQKLLWDVKCSCGEEYVISGNSLTKTNGTKQCKKCGHIVTSRKLIKHGQCPYKKPNSKTYNSWRGMKDRCDNKTHTSYKHYGGRGISYDYRWTVFENFLEDMGERPEGMSLDRIDVNGNYCKDNCKWSTNKEQTSNMRTNKFITYNGKTLTHRGWSRALGGGNNLVHDRIALGWSEEDAVTTPIGGKHA